MFSQQHRSANRPRASNDNGHLFARNTGKVARSGVQGISGPDMGVVVVSYVAEGTFIVSGSRAA